jgi:hypothetical protein
LPSGLVVDAERQGLIVGRTDEMDSGAGAAIAEEIPILTLCSVGTECKEGCEKAAREGGVGRSLS